MIYVDPVRLSVFSRVTDSKGLLLSSGQKRMFLLSAIFLRKENNHFWISLTTFSLTSDMLDTIWVNGKDNSIVKSHSI